MSAVILRDEIVHYEVLGRGRPLIFLHDWVGSWRYWITSMQAASIGFRTYALDFWGFGDSAKNSTYYTLDQQVALVSEFHQQMGIGRIALIGHGLGAIVALQFAMRNPDFIDRVMTIGLPYGENAIHPRIRSASPVELADWLLGRSPSAEAARVEAPKSDPLAIMLSLIDLQNIDLAALPYKLATPSLFVHGQNDPLIEIPKIEQFAALPEQAHNVLFEQSGHFPMLDEPSKFNRLLADFLSLGSGESPRDLQLKEEWKRRVR
jgi:pimeloyl-ACP methyl ester carboxylesterase